MIRQACGWCVAAVMLLGGAGRAVESAVSDQEAQVRDFAVDGVRLGGTLEAFKKRFGTARPIRDAAGRPPGHEAYMLEGESLAEVPVAYGFYFIDGRLYEIRTLWRKSEPKSPLLYASYHSRFGIFGGEAGAGGAAREFPAVQRTVTASVRNGLQIVAITDTALAEEVGKRLAGR